MIESRKARGKKTTINSFLSFLPHTASLFFKQGVEGALVPFLLYIYVYDRRLPPIPSSESRKASTTKLHVASGNTWRQLAALLGLGL